MNYLAGQPLVSRWAAALLHLQRLGQAAVVGHSHFHVDLRDAGGSHLGGVRRSDEDVIQIGQNHHQVLAGGRHAIRTMPVFLEAEEEDCGYSGRKRLLPEEEEESGGHRSLHHHAEPLTSLKTISNRCVSLLPCCLLCHG